jgi:2-dehydro-3-deoxy-D-arabinonate dehydratase
MIMTQKTRLFRTVRGWILERGGERLQVPRDAGAFLERDDLPAYVAGLRGLEAAEAASMSELLAPIVHQEVWAAGVTYFRSRTARMEEAKTGSGGHFYDLVYAADRPELFFKAAPWRVVGPGGSVRIRRDASWNVPEPELALLISRGGQIVGYTAGNDMSSRDIEGENPLYLPQAKVYDGACALGPALVIAGGSPPRDTRIALEIRRSSETVFSASTSLAEMKRDPGLLVEYLYRETSFPHGCVLLTGTGIVPPDDFTLQQADEINVTIDEVGTLTNVVG